MEQNEHNYNLFINNFTQFFIEKGFKAYANKSQASKVFYKEKNGVVQLFKYGKHPISYCFNLEYGTYYMGIEKSKAALTNVLNWHLRGAYGQLNPKYRGGFYYDNMNDIALKNLLLDIDQKLFLFLDQLSDLDYMRQSFPQKFDFDKIIPGSMNFFNSLCLFLGNEPVLPWKKKQ